MSKINLKDENEKFEVTKDFFTDYLLKSKDNLTLEEIKSLWRVISDHRAVVESLYRFDRMIKK